MNSLFKTTLIFVALASMTAAAFGQGWPQWGQNPQHSGFIPLLGQSPDRKLADLLYDPFVAQEQAENFGELLAHYQAPLTNGQDVFMEVDSGSKRIEASQDRAAADTQLENSAAGAWDPHGIAGESGVEDGLPPA